jgi:transcriptional antiterminator NusG
MAAGALMETTVLTETTDNVIKSDVHKRWYVVHAYSGFEKSVAQALRDRIVRTGMEERFGDVLVPTEEIIEMRAGQKRRSERKFFPGYVLVQIATNIEGGIPRIDSESWHLIKETPKVMGFIGGTADKPLPIKDEEADAILQRVQDGVEKPKPKVLFEPGQMVRVVDGPFNDFNGVVEEVNYDKSRVRVAVLIFGRSTPVELEFAQVEKA